MFDIVIILSATAAVVTCVYLLIQRQSALKAITRLQRGEIDFEIPVLGLQGSGKTTLLASLGAQLSQRGSEQLSTRLLSHAEEERVRGRALQPFDADTASIEHPLKPGQRSTRAMIYFERKAFEQDLDYGGTLEPEDAYFKLHFSQQGPLSNLCCRLTDIPGGRFADEKSHRGNIYPLIDRADGLILVIDGVQASQSAHEQLPIYTPYQQIIERFTQRASPGPIWVVITKADLIQDESLRDPSRWREVILKSIAPTLNLSEGSMFQIAFTSAHPSDDLGWGAISQDGERFLLGLREVIKARQTAREHLTSKCARAQRGAIWSSVLAMILAWFCWGISARSALPSIAGETQWDWASLETASLPYLAARTQLDHELHPLRVYRAQVIDGLNILRRTYHHHLALSFESWAQAHNLPKGQQRERAQTQFRLARSTFKRFQSQISRWERLTPEERALLKQIREALSSVQAWEALNDQPHVLSQCLTLLATHSLGPWGQRCDADRRVANHRAACALRSLFKRRQSILLTHSLSLAKTRSHKALQHVDNQLKERFRPFLEWRKAYHKLHDDPVLTRRITELETEAWGASWDHLKARLESKSDLNKPGHVLDRLKALQTFELHRQWLEKYYHTTLSMPRKIHQRWREHLNQESVKMSEGKVGIAEANPAELKQIIEWAKDYLDPKRAARVTMRERVIAWQTGVGAALKAKNADLLGQTLRSIDRDLIELESLEGRLEIADETQRWGARLKELTAWSAPHPIKVELSELECQEDQFSKHKINIDGLSTWDLDPTDYYLTIYSDGRLLLSWDKGDDATQTLTWSPWTPLSLSVFEADGERDHRTQGEQKELDDQQVGETFMVKPTVRFPQGITSLNTQSVCTVKIIAADRPPKWVFDLGLMNHD